MKIRQSGPYGCIAWGLTGCAIPLAISSALFFGVAYELSKETPDYEAVETGVEELTGEAPSRGDIKAVDMASKVFFLAMAGLCAGATMLVVWSAGKVEQVGRDKLAEKIYQLVDDNRPVDYCLFLRPFWITGKLVESDTGAPAVFLNWWVLLRSPHRQLENRIARTVRGRGPLIALGIPGESVGAGRISTRDDDWKRSAARLMANARIMFVVPSNNEGVLWEIRWLRRNRQLGKSVFIMPPEAAVPNMRYEWNATQAVLAEEGIALPEYNEQGMLLTFADLSSHHTAQRAISLTQENINSIVSQMP